MHKSSIIHIHTDTKFIHNVNSFENSKFENTIIIIGKRAEYIGIYKEIIQYYNYSRGDFLKIIDRCKTANMVVLYDLNFPKAYIANRLPKTVIIVWKFFGTELYSRISDYVHSEQTLKILQHLEKPKILLRHKQLIKKYLMQIKYRGVPAKEIDKAIFSRTNFLLGISKQEYEFLKSIWPNLPPFLQHNLPPYKDSKTFVKSKSNLIILGNNRRHYNNHLEIIQGIRQSPNKSDFKFLLMFAYGSSDRYSEAVRTLASNVKQIIVLEDFLTLENFKQLYNSADAFVMNGYRQMAMGNILESIQKNVKIYLNEKNLIYSWLKENGILVFSIEQFFKDLLTGNIALSENEAAHNRMELEKFSSQYSKIAFQESIQVILGEKREVQ